MRLEIRNEDNESLCLREFTLDDDVIDYLNHVMLCIGDRVTVDGRDVQSWLWGLPPWTVERLRVSV